LDDKGYKCVKHHKKVVKKILVFNVGSSSLKWGFFEGLTKKISGVYENINYEKTVKEIFAKLSSEKIDFIAHRIVHGGNIKSPVLINKEVKLKIKKFSEFAPLHNSKQLELVNFVEKISKLKQYAVFDNFFFANLPKISLVYAIPKEISEKYQIRRYGFHGLSHKSASKDLRGKTITCHLGSGSSISAIVNGKPLDTSMGFTPMEGLMMSTRSGTIDPGIILFLQKKGYDVEKMLNKNSGFKGLCKNEDFKYIKANIEKKEIKFAYDLFVYQLTKIIGSYISAMNGLDNLVFTGAIGENSPTVRQDVCKNLLFMGIKINKLKNNKNSEIISEENSRIKVYVKKCDEESEIAKEVLKKI
jgi:acetate kinase